LNTSIPPQPRSHRFFNWVERATLFVILAAVAFLAGKVAFGRVVDWTMANSPDATPRYAGWTNGVISELLPIGVLLFIRHQKRHGRTPGALAWSALVGAVLFSLIAQLAQAVPSVGGWIVAALPSVAFAVLGKLVVSMRPEQQPNESPEVRIKASVVSDRPTETPACGGLEEIPAPQPELTSAPELAREPEPATSPEPQPEAQAGPTPRDPRQHRVHPRSLTSRAAVEKAAKELGSMASTTAVAARAKVSESTARRYMPRAA
jgi:hypothetical protein